MKKQILVILSLFILAASLWLAFTATETAARLIACLTFFVSLYNLFLIWRLDKRGRKDKAN